MKIYVIGVDQFRVNLTELELMSSAPRLLYHQWWAPSSFSSDRLGDIQVLVNNELCRPVYGRFSVLKPKFHYADFPVTSATNP